MITAANWIVALLQAGAVTLMLWAAAFEQPAHPANLDHGALDRLAEDSTRYLDPQTTGSIRELLEEK